MHGHGFLTDLIVIFGVSVLVILILHRLRLPTITGFLISGMLLGPHGLSLVSDIERIEVLADVGVILLLFTIGMEFSLATLRRLWGPALAGALLPLAAFAALGAAASGPMGLAPGQGIFLGFLLGLSSTVIPLKALADRGQIDSPHGRAATGVAVFQDLLVVPMMLLTPYLVPGRTGAGGIASLAQLATPTLVLIQAVASIAGALVGAMWLVPRLLARLTALKSREVFIISIFLICLATAWLTSAVGLSLALGAFLAGLVISESEYGHQALADMLPFRDSLNSLFFVSIGMLMDPAVVAGRPALVLASAAGIILLKLVLIGGVLLMLGRRPAIALQAGLALSQVGEFSFVLMRFGAGYDLMSDTASQIFLSAAVLTMIVTPLILTACPPLLAMVQRWEERGWMPRPRRLDEPADPAAALSGHVIIVGYGFNGHNLARVLAEIGIPYVVLEMNPETVRAARLEGERILYGDAASGAVLQRLGAERARVLVLAISDPVSTRRAVAMAKRMFPALQVVVRTRYLTEVDELYRLGAWAVIPEEVETSMEIFSRVLERYGVPREALVKHARRIRAERYGLFREEGRAGSAPGTAEAPLAGVADWLRAADVTVCAVGPGSAAAGRSLKELDLRGVSGATVLAVLRGGAVTPNPPATMSLAEGDSVVLLGSPEQVGAATTLLTGGPSS